MGFFPTILEAFPRLEIFKPEIFPKFGGKKTWFHDGTLGTWWKIIETLMNIVDLTEELGASNGLRNDLKNHRITYQKSKLLYLFYPMIFPSYTVFSGEKNENL